MEPQEGSHDVCPVARAAQLLGDRWTLLILRDLASGRRRFGELEASTGMSPRVLSGRLHALEEDGLLQRRHYPEIPPRVEYALTDKGRAALPLIEQLRQFGEAWLSPAPAEKAAPARHWRRARRTVSSAENPRR